MVFLSRFKNTVLLWLLILSSCGNQEGKVQLKQQLSHVQDLADKDVPVVVGANRMEAYLPVLQGKKIAVVANQTSVIFRNAGHEMTDTLRFTHLVDSLLSLGIPIQKVFAPEHGFRGDADAGEHVKDGLDARTGLPVISLYGANRKPTEEQLEGLDMVVFDIQDVGVRFYTYIATLQLLMEACAEYGIPVMVLDRPNPNGWYVDGPVMEPQHSGFLGMTPIPLVYGLTIGEYAEMINEEGWLENSMRVSLLVIPLQHYTHETRYRLPIRPSPNLPNDISVNLYPSLGLFEGTNINAGRGTEFQFQRYGAPFMDSTAYDFSYVPAPNFGSKTPKHNGERCYGKDLSHYPEVSKVSLQWILDAYTHTPDKKEFFNTAGFTNHAGTEILQQQIEAGLSEKEIKETWQEGLERYRKIREKYIRY